MDWLLRITNYEERALTKEVTYLEDRYTILAILRSTGLAEPNSTIPTKLVAAVGFWNPLLSHSTASYVRQPERLIKIILRKTYLTNQRKCWGLRKFRRENILWKILRSRRKIENNKFQFSWSIIQKRRKTSHQKRNSNICNNQKRLRKFWRKNILWKILQSRRKIKN